MFATVLNHIKLFSSFSLSAMMKHTIHQHVRIFNQLVQGLYVTDLQVAACK